jgi:formylmethanofuran dehydrogenase subunit E
MTMRSAISFDPYAKALTPEQRAFVVQRFHEIREQHAMDAEDFKKRREGLHLEREEEKKIEMEVKARQEAGKAVQELFSVDQVKVDGILFGDEADTISKGSI